MQLWEIVQIGLSEGENWVKTVLTLFHVSQSQWIMCQKRKAIVKQITSPQNRHKRSTLQHVLLFVTILLHMNIVQQKSSHSLQPLLTTKEKWMCLTQDASFVCRFTTRIHWRCSWILASSVRFSCWPSHRKQKCKTTLSLEEINCGILLMKTCKGTWYVYKSDFSDITAGDYISLQKEPDRERIYHSSQISGNNAGWHQAILYSALFFREGGELVGVVDTYK